MTTWIICGLVNDNGWPRRANIMVKLKNKNLYLRFNFSVCYRIHLHVQTLHSNTVWSYRWNPPRKMKRGLTIPSVPSTQLRSWWINNRLHLTCLNDVNCICTNLVKMPEPLRMQSGFGYNSKMQPNVGCSEKQAMLQTKPKFSFLFRLTHKVQGLC